MTRNGTEPHGDARRRLSGHGDAARGSLSKLGCSPFTASGNVSNGDAPRGAAGHDRSRRCWSMQGGLSKPQPAHQFPGLAMAPAMLVTVAVRLCAERSGKPGLGGLSKPICSPVCAALAVSGTASPGWPEHCSLGRGASRGLSMPICSPFVVGPGSTVLGGPWTGCAVASFGSAGKPEQAQLLTSVARRCQAMAGRVAVWRGVVRCAKERLG